ncbi:MAG: hypothetical protein FJ039_03255 [Chloroflexi bacterium]|nr:hypothetical protein [Chloroflexota bacterium]
MAKQKKAPMLGRLTGALGSPSGLFLTIAVVLLVVSGLVYLAFDDFKTSALVFFAIGLLSLLLAAATGFDRIRSAARTRQGFYGVNTTVMTLVFLAIGAVVIYVGARQNAQFDLTETKQFSLSQQTKKILGDLDGNVQAVAFFVPTDPNQLLVRANALDLLEQYANQSGRFSYRVEDPELKPEEARRFGINADSQPGTIVFASEGNLQPVATLFFESRSSRFLPNPTLEQDFTSAILAVTHKQRKVVYFLTRHGERDIANIVDTNGYGLARAGIEGDNYEVRVLDLGSQQVVPQDAAVLIIASPKNDLLDEEVKPLDDYLRNGGKALFLLDPETPPKFRQVLKTWGVELGNGTIVDLASSVANDPRSPLVTRGNQRYSIPNGQVSEITRTLSDVTVYQRATSVSPVDAKPAADLNAPNVFYDSNKLQVLPLAVTTALLSWLETDPEQNQRQSGEPQGPLAIGVSVDALAPFADALPPEGQRKRTQIVVFGDSDFASNRFITSFANGDMLFNSVNWLADDINLISVRPKLAEPRLLIVTQAKWNFIRWSSLLILPVVIAAAGAIVWWRRR